MRGERFDEIYGGYGKKMREGVAARRLQLRKRDDRGSSTNESFESLHDMND